MNSRAQSRMNEALAQADDPRQYYQMIDDMKDEEQLEVEDIQNEDHLYAGKNIISEKNFVSDNHNFNWLMIENITLTYN